uniref:Uncharacterized protein n=1 Tax=Sinocyclocheilus rhinocerous TaxID=307959 RepID=A0A673GLZ9_9TELE
MTLQALNSSTLVFCFFLADPFISEEIDPVTVKNVSSLPWVLPCLLFMIFLQPDLVALYLNCSFHFRSTEGPSMTSGSKKRLRASLYSQSSGAGCFCNKKQEIITISSIEPCCLMRSMALLGPIPFIVPQ